MEKRKKTDPCCLPLQQGTPLSRGGRELAHRWAADLWSTCKEPDEEQYQQECKYN